MKNHLEPISTKVTIMAKTDHFITDMNNAILLWGYQ